MVKYVSLHTHSEYSLLDGLSRIKDLVAKAKEYEMPAIALTDHGTMHGAIKFYLACKEAGINPIIGVEAYQAQRSRHDKQPGVDKDQYHLILLAKNYTGYKNLMKMVSIAALEGFYYKPRLDWEVLEKYHEGIICTTACEGGLVGSLVGKNERIGAQGTIRKLEEIFGKDSFYLEIQHHPGMDRGNEIYGVISKFSREMGIPLVATNDSHYTDKDDAEAQETLLCIQTQKTWLDKNRPLSMIDYPDFYFKSPQHMADEFAQFPDALENTLKIANDVNVEIPLDKLIFPPFEVPKGETPDSYLEKLVWEHVGDRYETVTPEVKDRINHELKIIEKVGYATYLLVFSDIARWAHEHGIMRNVRGSGASSIVNYIIGTSTLDPIRYRIPFERFLYVGRPSPADIDFDIADAYREQAVEYVRDKYGSDRVAQVITFGTMEAKAAVRDVARALGHPYAVGDRLSKLIPFGSQGFPMTIKHAMELTPELDQAYKNEPETRKIIDLAEKLEGVARHASVHAAGVVIADKDITEYTPLQLDPKGGKIITQYDMYSLDLNVSKHAVGLMKMDFLGLRNLTILGEAVRFVKQYKGITDFDIENISMDDQAVFQMLTKGDTTGVFQLESAGMRKLVRELKPTTAEDLGALVALYRPGPMEIIPDFIKRKSHPELIFYPHDDLRPILEETYGLIIYQEQVMEIANKLAGYSLGESDGFRKAMGKKKPELMKKEGEKFRAGMIKKGYTAKLADQLFGLIEKFAAYGFNKAHSVSYGVIAYQTAYMKLHFPVEYMTAMLTAESRGNTGDTKNEKIQMCIDECRRMKIIVLPPDINKSEVEFGIEGNSIRFGLSAIKNVGAAAIESILAARKNGLPFSSLSDFARRVDLQKVNRKTLESLVKAGAMDKFGKRAAMLAALDKIIKESHNLSKQISSGQTGMFESAQAVASSFELPDMEELPKDQLLLFEREFLGFYLSEHPAQKALEKLTEMVTHEISELTADLHLGKIVTIGGLVTGSRRVFTKKNNEEMAFITIQGRDGGKIDCVIFPKLYSNGAKKACDPDSVIVCTGRVDNRDEKLSIIVDSIHALD
ncbi:MAG: DNA polymerase III subunit alpha [Patescibacteria group bacterium]|nr:DNA polymerase III subunit alpha [Patescibacteria group bacterium]MCL5432332.1 DNA polymerase III subunit alpha [Patescibacteria group bacterium]